MPPIQVDHARPVRTVDTRGNIVGTDTNRAAPMKAVDSVGRAVQQDAARVAEKAAEAAFPGNTNAGNEGASNENAGNKSSDNDNGKESAEKTGADIRKEWLSIQKLKRSLAEKEKKAAESAARAEAFEKVRTAAESGEDPVAILKAAGLDPVKYYQHLTKYALSDKGREAAAEDPVQKQLREHKERISQYEKDVQQLRDEAKNREDLAAKNQVIQDKIIPFLKTNEGSYDCLFAEYGANTAIEVFKTWYELYEKEGTPRDLKAVADEMNEYWKETIGKGLEAAAKLPSFANRFAQAVGATSQTSNATETRSRSVTLSNRPSQAALVPSSPAVRKPHETWEERAARITAQHGG